MSRLYNNAFAQVRGTSVVAENGHLGHVRPPHAPQPPPLLPRCAATTYASATTYAYSSAQPQHTLTTYARNGTYSPRRQTNIPFGYCCIASALKVPQRSNALIRDVITYANDHPLYRHVTLDLYPCSLALLFRHVTVSVALPAGCAKHAATQHDSLTCTPNTLRHNTIRPTWHTTTRRLSRDTTPPPKGRTRSSVT